MVLKNTFKGVFDNTWDIGNFGVHIFCPQMAQELPKKCHEIGPPEQLPTDGLSQIDYRRGPARVIPTSDMAQKVVTARKMKSR